MKIEEQSEIYIKRLTERKRNPVKPATLAAYQSYIRNWILPRIGSVEVSAVENGVMRNLVASMDQDGRSASTIAGVEQTLKAIVASAIDDNGNELYPRKWNPDFIDAPVITGQKAPIITALELNRAILTAETGIRPLLILLAATGLRVGEALALKGSPDPQGSYFDRDRQVLVIRKAIYKGQEQATKTAAGIREVDLDPKLSAILCNEAPQNGGIRCTNLQESRGYMFPNSLPDARLLRKAAMKAGIPGFHSLRRFRITHLDSQGVPRGLVQFWCGHSGTSITDRYVKVASDVQARKDWAAKAGLGFEL